MTLILCLLVGGVISPATASVSDWSEPLHLLGREIAPGTTSKFPFIPDRTFEASYLNMPVFVARGVARGPTLCLIAGIHGDELNGVEIVRRAFAKVKPLELRGTVIALPSINAEGVRTGNRYLSDRRDLNRAFPGSAGGSVARLIAHAVFSKVVGHCDALLDFHTASNQRANLPQIRADLADPAIRDLAIHFGLGIVVNGAGPDGSLRRESALAGIPAIIYEAGEPFRFQEDEIERGVLGVENIMAYLDMTGLADQEVRAARVYERSRWIRTARGNGGFFFPTASLGDRVETGDLLGEIVDPLTDTSIEIVSPLAGEIIGMAVPQPVLSGYALFNVAWHDFDYISVNDGRLITHHKLEYAVSVNGDFRVTEPKSRVARFNDTPYRISLAAFIGDDSALMMHAEEVADSSGASDYRHLAVAKWPNETFRSNGPECLHIPTEEIEEEHDLLWLRENGFEPSGSMLYAQYFTTTADMNTELVISILQRVESCDDPSANSRMIGEFQARTSVTRIE